MTIDDVTFLVSSDAFMTSNATIQTILTTGAKPSFLLWDKVYRKAITADDETWLIYALESVLQVDEDKFNKDLALRYVNFVEFVEKNLD